MLGVAAAREVGAKVMVASVGEDGCVAVWGRGHGGDAEVGLVGMVESPAARLSRVEVLPGGNVVVTGMKENCHGFEHGAATAAAFRI